MAGLFGWYGNATSADPENSHRLLAQMCRGAIFTAETNQNSAVAVTSSIGGRSILRTGDIVVAIAGLPVWNDGDLAAIAKTDGHAAALGACLSSSWSGCIPADRWRFHLNDH